MGSDAADDDSLAPIQLLEGHEYRYEWEALPDFVTIVSTDRKRRFSQTLPTG